MPYAHQLVTSRILPNFIRIQLTSAHHHLTYYWKASFWYPKRVSSYAFPNRTGQEETRKYWSYNGLSYFLWNREGRKLCRKVKVLDGKVLKHFHNGDFNKDYDRALRLSSILNFMKDPTGDLPWEEDPKASPIHHLPDPQVSAPNGLKINSTHLILPIPSKSKYLISLLKAYWFRLEIEGNWKGKRVGLRTKR